MARVTDLSGEDLQHVLDLLSGADSVELKLTLLEDRRAHVAGKLGIDPMDAQIRQVFFFDTPDLALNKAGVVVRARRRQGETGDTVVKIRPVNPGDLPDELRGNPEFGVEVDAMPGGYVCSASFKGSSDNDEIRGVAGGTGKARKLFSKQQRAFYEEHAPDGLAIDDLQVLGPIPTLRVKFKSEGYKRPMVGELSEAFQAAVEWRAFLGKHEVDISGEQQTKTKAALEYFTRAG
jgi:hypothetical protein